MKKIMNAVPSAFGWIILAFLAVAFASASRSAAATPGYAQVLPSDVNPASIVRQVNAGSGAVNDWTADTGYTGGSVAALPQRAIDTSKTPNPAPAATYTSERWGNFSYRLDKLTPNASYTLRLHFAEFIWNQPGQRVFDVTANNRPLLTNFDILTQTTPNTALVKDFTLNADPTGAINLTFTTKTDAAKISAIQLLTSSTTTPPSTNPPTSTAPPSGSTTSPSTETTTCPACPSSPSDPPDQPDATEPPGSGKSRLRVSDNQRFLVNSDGSPFVWQADTAWALISRSTPDEVIRYLDTRKAQGYNVVQTVGIFPPEGAYASGIGVSPINGNLANRNEAYWKHADFVIEQAQARGMHVAFLPIWSSEYATNSLINTGNAQEYGRFLGERYRHSNLIWVLGGDSQLFPEVTRELAKGIAIGVSGSEDYSKVLMSFHPGSPQTSSGYQGEQWLDFNMDQSSHCHGYSYTLVGADYAKSPTKPVLDAEPLYEDHPFCWDTAQGFSNAQQVRNNQYAGTFAGGFGFTYGNQSVWQWYSPRYAPILVRDGNYWHDALGHEAATQMIHLRKLLESRPVLSRVPDQSVLASDAYAGEARIQATRNADGAYLMVYTGSGRPFSVNLDKLSGETARLWWFDPRTGQARDAGLQPSTGNKEMTPPDGRDWVFVADDAARGFGAPGN